MTAPNQTYKQTRQALEDLPIATYCTYGAADDGNRHRLVLTWDISEPGSDGPFWACLDCDPNALSDIARGDLPTTSDNEV